MSNNELKICIVGAGSIGCYIGGRLAATGSDVSFIGRQRLAGEVHQHGLHLTDYLGGDLRVSPDRTNFSTKPDALADADLILVTVKSAATAEVGEMLAAHSKPDAVVISFQNGLNNADVLRESLPQHTVLTGMVQYNVLNRGEGRFHQGSEGGLEADEHEALKPFLPAFEQAGLNLELHADMRAIQWAKLLLNLNNPVNALSGLPLKAELSQRSFRRCVAAAQAECLGLLDEAGITPAKLTPLPPHWLPKLLCVPDGLFKLLANKMLAIDPLARSSMWEDLEAGRRTEVDWINGEVIKLAGQQGRAAPVNAKLIQLIREAENGGKRDWSGDELLAALR